MNETERFDMAETVERCLPEAYADLIENETLSPEQWDAALKRLYDSIPADVLMRF